MPQLGRPSTEITQGHLGSQATSGGKQGYLSLHTGRLVEECLALVEMFLQSPRMALTSLSAGKRFHSA